MRPVLAALVLAWFAIASPLPLHATDHVSKGPTRSQAVTKFGCALAMLWTFIEIGESCFIRDDFQRQLDRSATQVEGHILAIDPDAAGTLRGGRAATKLEMGAETRSGEICTGGRDKTWLEMYKNLRAQGSDALRRWTYEAMKEKADFDPPDCF